MDVREIAGACGTLRNVVPTVWRADPETVCILLDNPKTGRWLLVTLNACGENPEKPSAHRAESS